MDDSYQTYINRVARLTLPEAYKSQAQHTHTSPKFQRSSTSAAYEAIAFPGYSVITPPWVEETENQAFYEHLGTFQKQLVETLSPDVLIPLPPDSFHMTLADLIWDSSYRHADENPDFQTKLRDRIQQSFEQCRGKVHIGQPSYWQIMGLVLMPRALGVCLAPKDEDSYNRLLHLRRAIYQQPELFALGVEQQYHFTAHITLGYFGEGMAQLDRDAFSETINALNLSWLDLEMRQPFLVHRAELRKFDDMTRYYREPDWPALSF
ncbi:MAG TPA: hypothetical protein V6C88_05005 [Chroococcidiopsis sp.]